MNAKSIERILQGPGGWALAIGAGVLGVYVIYKIIGNTGQKAASALDGILSGNNTLTRDQLDMQGNPETAYQGRGLVGTLGAGANTVSGGFFASLGNWLGGSTYDFFNGSTTPLATNSANGTGSNVAGSGSSDGSASDINFGLIDGADSGW